MAEKIETRWRLCRSAESMDTFQETIKPVDQFLIIRGTHPQIVAAIKNGIVHVEPMTVPRTCSTSAREVRNAIEDQDILGIPSWWIVNEMANMSREILQIERIKTVIFGI